jgi:bifunctional non-homologous end joining protein LigD
MPQAVAPMLATLAERLPPDESSWSFEVKWDGVRVVAFVTPSGLRLQGRRLVEVTGLFPELAPLGPALAPHRAVLDGEVVCPDSRGRPDFGLVQHRIHLASPEEALRRAERYPAAYMVFDLLHLDGRSTMPLPYWRRRELLESLEASGPSWRTPAAHVGQGQALLAATREQGLEGLVAKRLTSPYEPGRRSRSWLKVKNHLRQELVVGGWVEGEGSRRGTVGALLVGYWRQGALRYAGKVGTGFRRRDLDELWRLLGPLAEPACPFVPPPPVPSATLAKARFVRPELVVEVSFAELTRSGTLRAPSFKGLRLDKDPTEVVLEVPWPAG